MVEVQTLSGFENMKIDYENLLRSEKEGITSLRLYMWKESTLSIGYSQEPMEVSLPLVKRPTGGGALLHGLDLSFSYSGLRKSWGGTFTKIYKNFMGMLLEGLKGLEPSLEMSSYRGAYDGYFCYFYPTLGEITYRGKKLVACAMRLGKEAFLIHGSLFLDLDYGLLSRLSHMPEESLRGRITTFKEMGIDKEEVLKVFKGFKI